MIVYKNFDAPNHTIKIECECGLVGYLFDSTQSWNQRILLDFMIGKCPDCGKPHFSGTNLDVLATMWDNNKWNTVHEIIDFISDRPSKETML